MDDLVLYGVGTVVTGVFAAGLLAWAAGQLAGIAVHQAWPRVPPAAAPGIAVRLPAHLSDPARAWPPGTAAQLAGPVIFYAVVLALLTAVLAMVVTVADGVRRYRAAEPGRDRDASGSWATRRQLRRLLATTPEPNRVVLGKLPGLGHRRIVAAEPARSVLVVAPTQAGKTTRFVIPTVVRWSGPMLVTSVKTDVLRVTYAARRRRGGVAVFDPTGSLKPDDGIPTVRWSPLLACTTYAEADAAAAWLVEAAGELRAGENSRFWESLGAKLLGPLLYAAAGIDAPLAQVARWVDRREVEPVTEILTWLGDEDALDAWAASCAREERQRDSVYATAESLLKAFTTPSVRAATTVVPGQPVLDIPGLFDRGETLYLVAPAHEQTRLRPLFEALVQAVLREAQNRYASTGRALDPPLMLMLDEAANIAPLRELASYAATGAGQGIQVCSVWQDLAQIEALYGRRARTVVNGHTARAFLPGSADLATLDELSKMIGEHQLDRTSVSVGGDGQRSINRNPNDSRVAPPEYLRQLPGDVAVVLYGREPVMRLRTTPWYRDRQLRRWMAHNASPESRAPGRRPTPERSVATVDSPPHAVPRRDGPIAGERTTPPPTRWSPPVGPDPTASLTAPEDTDAQVIDLLRRMGHTPSP